MNKIKELGFIIGNVYFSKDTLTYACTEEYLKELVDVGVVDLTEVLSKFIDSYEETSTNTSI